MKLITRRDATAETVEHFASFARTQPNSWDGPLQREWRADKIAANGRILALGPDPTPDAVQDAVGEMGFTSPQCDECERWVPQVVRLGRYDVENDHQNQLCGDCLIKALNLTEENC